MHVGLNAHLLNRAQTYRAAGISRHIVNLIEALGRRDRCAQFTVFAGPSGAQTTAARSRRLRYRTSALPTERPSVRILWEQLAAPIELARLRIDVFHGLANVAPLAAPCRSVVTVHDLSFERLPHLFHRGNRAYLSAMTRASVRRASRVIAVSESTRREIVDLWRIAPERIVVVPNGVEPHFHPRPVEEVERFRAERGLPAAFILHFGTLEPRKNLQRLIRAYAGLKRRHGIPHALVLAGGKGWLYESIFAEVRALGLERDVLFPGYVPFDQQPLWYNAATAFAYPSLYEGFGIPPLEAMACGTPVICASTTALPEVVGTAGMLVDPLDEEALMHALDRVLSDPSLRARMRADGMARAARFNWDDIASQTVAVYREVAGSSRRAAG